MYFLTPTTFPQKRHQRHILWCFNLKTINVERKKKDDPALLMFPDTWLTTTMSLSPEARGYLINLVMQDFSRKGLPTEIKELATLAIIPINKFRSFKKIWDTELSHYFTLNDEGKYISNFVKNVIQIRANYVSNQRKYGIVGRIVSVFKRKIKDELLDFKLKKILYSLPNDHLLQINESEENIQTFISNFLANPNYISKQNPIGGTPGGTPPGMTPGPDPHLNKNKDENENKLKNNHKDKDENISDDTSSSNQSPITDSPDTNQSASQSSTSTPSSDHHSQTYVDINPSFSDKFNSWLHEYGNTNGSFLAYQIWKNLSPNTHIQIMEHTKKFIQIAEDVRYRPSAEKYLSTKRYLDDLSQFSQNGKEKPKLMPEELKQQFGIKP